MLQGPLRNDNMLFQVLFQVICQRGHLCCDMHGKLLESAINHFHLHFKPISGTRCAAGHWSHISLILSALRL